MRPNITDDTFHEVRVIETDQAAVSATIRRLELFIGIVFAISIVITILAFCIYIPQSDNPMFHQLLMVLFLLGVIVLGFIHFVGPFCLRKMDIVIGNDFIAGPNASGLPLMRLLGHKTILDYNDIVQVSLDISKGQITGATVIGKGLAMILVRRVTEPHTVIRAIREHTGPEVRWHRSPTRLTKLSGDEVDSLINKGEEKNFNKP